MISKPIEEITLEQVADILSETLLPFYKGFPDGDGSPKFRRELRGDETTNVLTTLHNLIHTIRIQEKEKANG